MASAPPRETSHREIISLTVICLLILGLIFLLTVGLDLRTEKRLTGQLAEVTSLKEQRDIISPLVAELQKNESSPQLKQGDLTDSALAEAPAEEYEATLTRMLRECNLSASTITPDVYSVLTGTGTIRVDLTARGAFADFRRLILMLGNLSYLSGIEKFRIQQERGGVGLEMFLQLSLTLEKTEIAHEESQ